jgi:hypothetical protein
MINKINKEIEMEKGFSTKDVLLLIYIAIFLGFISLINDFITSMVYLFGNIFIMYFLSYFAFKYKKE